MRTSQKFPLLIIFLIIPVFFLSITITVLADEGDGVSPVINTSQADIGSHHYYSDAEGYRYNWRMYDIEVTDPQGQADIQSVILYYPQNMGVYQELYDDGLTEHGDRQAGDGFYSFCDYDARLPSMPYGDYELVATDWEGNTTTLVFTLTEDMFFEHVQNPSPGNGSTVYTATPEFTWDPLAEATMYRVEVLTATGDSIWIRWLPNSQTSVIYNDDGSGEPLTEGTYFWEMSAVDQDWNASSYHHLYLTYEIVVFKEGFGERAVVETHPAMPLFENYVVDPDFELPLYDWELSTGLAGIGVEDNGLWAHSGGSVTLDFYVSPEDVGNYNLTIAQVYSGTDQLNEDMQVCVDGTNCYTKYDDNTIHGTTVYTFPQIYNFTSGSHQITFTGLEVGNSIHVPWYFFNHDAVKPRFEGNIDAGSHIYYALEEGTTYTTRIVDVQVIDPQGLDNIESVKVYYPDGTFYTELFDDGNPIYDQVAGDGKYNWDSFIARQSVQLPFGEYSIVVTDIERHTATRTFNINQYLMMTENPVPTGGAVVTTSHPLLSWDANPDATHYWVLVFDVSQLGNEITGDPPPTTEGLIWRRFIDRNQLSTSVYYSDDGNGEDLSPGKTYFWEVIACDDSGNCASYFENQFKYEGIVYEDAEDELISGWDIYDNSPEGATITNVFDEDKNSNVIEFVGAGTANGYRLRNEDGSSWNNTEHTIIQWSMKYAENFVIYISTQTTAGHRYIYYTPAETDLLGDARYVHHGLGTAMKNGQGHMITRDLVADLHDAQPGVDIISVDGFLIRGSGRVDDIQMLEAYPPELDSDEDGLADVDEINQYHTNPNRLDTDSDGLPDYQEVMVSNTDPLLADTDGDGYQDSAEVMSGTDPVNETDFPSITVYEDAEDLDTNGWDIYDNTPEGATIMNVYDTNRNSQVIELSGSAKANGYRLRNPTGFDWVNTQQTVIQWSMKFVENFSVYASVQTTDGHRYIYYTTAETDNLGDARYVHHGLGAAIKDGEWHTITRDLAADLHEAQPGIDIISVDGFLIRGSGRIDDIQLLGNYPPDLDSDNDGLFDVDEINTYHTNPNRPDTDSDGLTDYQEVMYYGTNPLAEDTDADGYSDSAEILAGTNPNDVNSYPTTIVYEDAEDGLTSGWDVYDNSPEGVAITNVYDADRGDQVIEFTGAATANGYRLRNPNGSNWANNQMTTIQWSLKYSENFIVYVGVQTTDGHRYIYYTTAETDNLGDARYIHHGLGASAKNGQWQTITRDLVADLHDAQPNIDIITVDAFLIRGSGRVDNIQLQ